MAATPPSTSGPIATPRLLPSLGAAAAVFVVYVVLVNGIQMASGVPYAEFFRSADNAWKSANPSLAAGVLMLLAFVAWSRWDGIWRDPQPLPMTPLMWLAPVVFVLLMIARLVLKLSDGVATDLLLAIVVAGIGVGIAEELLFRGVILRALRTNGRSEAWAMLWCSVWFGAMHASNIFVGSPPLGVAIQIILAALSGVTLYLLRRSRGWLLTGMIIHGLWDVSTFLPAPASSAAYGPFELAALAIAPLVALVSGSAAWRHDRRRGVAVSGLPGGASGA